MTLSLHPGSVRIGFSVCLGFRDSGFRAFRGLGV